MTNLHESLCLTWLATHHSIKTHSTHLTSQAALELQNQLFMIGGTPRPVRACLAKAEHLPYSTIRSQAKLPPTKLRIVKKGDSDYDTLTRQRDIAVRHLLEIDMWKQVWHPRFGVKTRVPLVQQIHPIDKCFDIF